MYLCLAQIRAHASFFSIQRIACSRLWWSQPEMLEVLLDECLGRSRAVVFLLACLYISSSSQYDHTGLSKKKLMLPSAATYSHACSCQHWLHEWHPWLWVSRPMLHRPQWRTEAGDKRGSEWEPIKISSKFESSAYVPKSPKSSSVLTQGLE